jgi:phosphoribosylglycinamide formyltransferase-1
LYKLAVLISGGGSNLQALLDAQALGLFSNAYIKLVLADRKSATGLQRAKAAGVNHVLIPRKNQFEMLPHLRENGIDRIICSGYLSILPPEVVAAYRGQIINIHPSLIPLFCGMGFYGIKIHEAVLASGMKVTGATIHFVDEGVDTGNIIDQRAVRVEEGDTPESLRDRVLAVEHKMLVDVVKQWTEGQF